MRNKYIIFFIIAIFISGLNLFDFNLIEKYRINKSYSNTEGAKFLSNLDLEHKKEQEQNNLNDIPYKVSFYLRNNKINFQKEILYKDNRYYVPLSEFLSYFDTKQEIHEDNIIINNVINIDLTKKTYEEDNKTTNLREGVFEKNNDYYISFFDLCEILKLNTYWDYDNNNIYISKKPLKESTEEKKINSKKKRAFIRFEDFTAGDVYMAKGSLEKVRAVADYMNENHQKFSVSWVPKYINNSNNIYNDLSKIDFIQNANFIFTLDYFISRGEKIGLHGYTHQYKDSDSVSGFEFGDYGYTDSTEIRRRVENALRIANKVDIPVSYWETPHYKTTNEQQQIFEEYFKIMYEPSIGIYNKKIITSKTNGITKYIPTPMGYVDDDDGKGLLERIRNKSNNEELSLFYHLSIEIKSINVFVDSNGEIKYSYDNNSILNQIVKAIDSLGYKFEDSINM